MINEPSAKLSKSEKFRGIYKCARISGLKLDLASRQNSDLSGERLTRQNLYLRREKEESYKTARIMREKVLSFKALYPKTRGEIQKNQSVNV